MKRSQLFEISVGENLSLRMRKFPEEFLLEHCFVGVGARILDLVIQFAKAPYTSRGFKCWWTEPLATRAYNAGYFYMILVKPLGDFQKSAGNKACAITSCLLNTS
jgi:hypothetical protein